MSEQQRQLLEKAEESCGALSQRARRDQRALAARIGRDEIQPQHGQARSVLADAIAAQPDLPERTVKTVLIADSDPSVDGDAVKLKTAFASILHALRRELVTSDELVVQVDARDGPAGRSLWITIGESNQMAELLQLEPAGVGGL